MNCNVHTMTEEMTTNNMILGNPRDGLIELLRSLSVRFGKFQLSSGKESDFFIDCKQSILTGVGHVWAGQLMLEAVAKEFPEATVVAGVELGGCPLASAVSLLSAAAPGFHVLDAVYVRKARKDHGTGNLVEGKGGMREGAPVVLLEDVFTTGGSALRAVATLREEKFRVLGVIGLVDRLEGAEQAFRDAGVKAFSILTREDLKDE